MEIREKLMRNEILHLAENLRVISQELITLQDFVKTEFGAKYIRFCKSRQEDDEGIQSIQGISQRSSIPTVSSTIPIPQPARSFSSSNYSKRNRNGSTRIRSSDESEDSFRNTRTATPALQEFHISPDDECSDVSNPALFNAWKIEDEVQQDAEDDFDSYIPGSDYDEEDGDDYGGSRGQEINDPKRKKVEKESPLSRPSNLLKFVKSTRCAQNGKEKDMVALDGYLYHINNSQEKTDYYLCNVRKKGCKARLIVKKDLGNFQQKGEHSHLPMPDRIRAQEVMAAGKALALQNPGLPMQQVMSHIESMIVEEPTQALGLGKPSEVKRKIRRARQKAKAVVSPGSYSEPVVEIVGNNILRLRSEEADVVEHVELPPFCMQNLHQL